MCQVLVCALGIQCRTRRPGSLPWWNLHPPLQDLLCVSLPTLQGEEWGVLLRPLGPYPLQEPPWRRSCPPGEGGVCCYPVTRDPCASPRPTVVAHRTFQATGLLSDSRVSRMGRNGSGWHRDLESPGSRCEWTFFQTDQHRPAVLPHSALRVASCVRGCQGGIPLTFWAGPPWEAVGCSGKHLVWETVAPGSEPWAGR